MWSSFPASANRRSRRFLCESERRVRHTVADTGGNRKTEEKFASVSEPLGSMDGLSAVNRPQQLLKHQNGGSSPELSAPTAADTSEATETVASGTGTSASDSTTGVTGSSVMSSDGADAGVS